MAVTFHKHPAHPPPVRRHNEPVILLVTVRGLPGSPLLASEAVTRALLGAWAAADQWTVGSYVLMPDHVHLFSAPAAWEHASVRRWVGYWKRMAGTLAPELKRAFQADCWDTQMRSQEHYLRKLEYVRNNPVRKGLVADWRDWPYQGCVKPLDWV